MRLQDDQSKNKTLKTKRTPGSDETVLPRVDLPNHFLKRMEWYLQLRDQCSKDEDCEEWKIRAVDRAIYSTFRDCEKQGILSKAKALIGSSEKPSSLTDTKIDQ